MNHPSGSSAPSPGLGSGETNPSFAATSERRAEMLALLQQAALENSQRRKRQRAALFFVPPALLAAAGLWWAFCNPAWKETAVAAGGKPNPGSALLPAPEVLASQPSETPPRPETEPSATGKSPLPAVATGRRVAGILVESLDDDQLLELLSEIGRPAGLARINGRTELVAMENPPADDP